MLKKLGLLLASCALSLGLSACENHIQGEVRVSLNGTGLTARNDLDFVFELQADPEEFRASGTSLLIFEEGPVYRSSGTQLKIESALSSGTVSMRAYLEEYEHRRRGSRTRAVRYVALRQTQLLAATLVPSHETSFATIEHSAPGHLSTLAYTMVDESALRASVSWNGVEYFIEVSRLEDGSFATEIVTSEGEEIEAEVTATLVGDYLSVAQVAGAVIQVLFARLGLL